MDGRPASDRSSACSRLLVISAGTSSAFAAGDPAVPLCGPARPGEDRCFALVKGAVKANGQIRAVYRSTYGLPPCTTANGCFQKVNQDGEASPRPAGDTGWAGEISLDLDMASAICPMCKLILAEADSPDPDLLGKAVDTAADLGATQISNSYGGDEDNTSVPSEHYYDHPRIDVVVSSGNSGYGVQYPASSQYVTAVGGTSLTRVGLRRPNRHRLARWDRRDSGHDHGESRPRVGGQPLLLPVHRRGDSRADRL